MSFMYVSHLQYRSFELSIRFVHVRVGGKNRYILKLLQIWSHLIVIALLVRDEEEDTYIQYSLCEIQSSTPNYN